MSATGSPSETQEAEQIIRVPIDAIRVEGGDRAQRGDVDGLAKSIETRGLIAPVVVRPRNGVGDGQYRIVCGRRRLAALRLLKWPDVPARVVHVDDAAAADLELVENVQRADLHPMVEAAAVERLLAKRTIADVAACLGWPAAKVARRAKLLELSPKWRKAAEDPEHPVAGWTADLLQQIAALPAALQDDLIRVLEWDRRPTAAELRAWIAGRLGHLAGAPWDLADKDLQPLAGSCADCAKRTGHDSQSLLFDVDQAANGDPGGERCLDRVCFENKMIAHLGIRLQALQTEHRAVGLAYHKQGTGDRSELRIKTLEKQAGTKTISTWYGVERCKKSDPGAKPHLYVDGPKPGSVGWFRTPQRPSAGPAKPKPTPKELRQRLERKRGAFVAQGLAKRLETLKPAAVRDALDDDRLIGELVEACDATFGGRQRTGKREPVRDRAAVLLLDNWRFDLASDRDGTAAKRVATALRLDLADLYAEARAKFPDKQNKKPAAKRVAKKATKRAAGKAKPGNRPRGKSKT